MPSISTVRAGADRPMIHAEPGVDTPPVHAVAITDGQGNVLTATPTGTGTATLTTTATPTPAIPVTLTGTPPASQVINATPTTYRGFALRETTGTTGAVVVIWDNATTTTGPVLDQVSLAPGESAREDYARTATAGIYAQIVSGTIAGTIFKA